MSVLNSINRLVLTGVGLIITAAIAGAMITTCSTPRLSIKVNDEITFNLAKIITSENAPDETISGGKIYPDSNFARLIFKADYPQEWLKGTTLDEVIKSKFDPAMTEANMTNFRTCFPGGICSGSMETWVHADKNGKDNSNVYLTLDLIQMPVTLKTVQFQLYKFGDKSTIRTFTIPNPVYVKAVEPLTAAGSLPMTTTQDRLTVTLNHLVAKVSDDRNRRDDQGHTVGELMNRGKFFRADGTLDDPNVSLALITIDDTTSGTHWKIEKLKVSYGIEQYPLMQPGQAWEQTSWGAFEPEPSRLIVFPLDLSIVQQPVKLSFSLVHQEDEKKSKDFEFIVQPTEADVIAASL